jgi:hypothetical protein
MLLDHPVERRSGDASDNRGVEKYSVILGRNDRAMACKGTDATSA